VKKLNFNYFKLIFLYFIIPRSKSKKQENQKRKKIKKARQNLII